MELEIQNSIWPTQSGERFFRKSLNCTKNQGALVSWITDSKNETKNPKLNMVHTKWGTRFFKNQCIALKIEVFQFSGSLMLEMNCVIVKLTWLTQSCGDFV